MTHDHWPEQECTSTCPDTCARCGRALMDSDPSPESVDALKRYVHGEVDRLEAYGIRVWTNDGAVFIQEDDGLTGMVGVPLDLAHYLADCIRLAADTQLAEQKA